MSIAERAWFLPDDCNRPTGPFTGEQVFSRWQKGQISEATLCWRDGMPGWRPLAEVEPFADAIRRARDDSGLIHFNCECGSGIVMSQKFAGCKARCKACGRTVTVPPPSTVTTAQTGLRKKGLLKWAALGVVVTALTAVISLAVVHLVWSKSATVPADAPLVAETVADQPAPEPPQTLAAPITEGKPEAPTPPQKGESAATAEMNAAIEELKTAVTKRRIDAANRLGSMGPQAEAAVAALSRVLLEDEEHRVRVAAARALGQIKSTANASVQGLCKAAANEDEHGGVRNTALRALGEIGVASSPVVRTVVSVLNSDKNDRAREVAAEVLGQLRPVKNDSILALVEAIAGRRNVSAAAVKSLAAMGQTTVSALKEATKDNRIEVRMGALSALREMGSRAEDAVPQIMKTLEDTEPPVRERAAQTLGAIGCLTAECVDELTDALQDQHAAVVAAAAESLGKLGPAAAASAPRLVETLNDYDETNARRTAATALGRIGSASPATLPALIDALIHLPPAFRRSLVDALGTMGPDAKEAIPTLLGVLEEQPTPWSVHARAIRAVRKIGPDMECAPVLIRLCSESRLRSRAIVTLSAIGKPAVPLLIRALLRDKDPGGRVAAADALGRIGSDGTETVQALAKSLADPDWGLRQQAANALGVIRPRSDAAVQALAKMLSDGAREGVEFRERAKGKALRSARHSEQGPLCAAADTLGAIGLPTRAAIDSLTFALRHDHPVVRAAAARALGKIGPGANSATVALKKCLEDDSDARVLGDAAEALKRMGVTESSSASAEILPGDAAPGSGQAKEIKRVLVDAYGGWDWWCPQLAWEEDETKPHGGKRLADYMRSLGWSVTETPRRFGRASIKPNELGGYQLAILVRDDHLHDADDKPHIVRAYLKWVKEGGRLIVDSCATAVNSSLGLKWVEYKSGMHQSVITEWTPSHFITSGVERAHGFTGGVMASLVAHPEEARILGWFMDGPHANRNQKPFSDVSVPAPAFGYMPYGGGVVVFVSHLTVLEQVDYPYGDNGRLVRNLLDWLAAYPNEPGIPGQIIGRVIDRRGRPVRDATIEILRSHEEHELVRHRSTGANGGFHSGPLAPGSYDVRVFRRNHACDTIGGIEVNQELSPTIELQIPSLRQMSPDPADDLPASVSLSKSLVTKYAPVLWLHKLEVFVPVRAEFMLDHSVIDSSKRGRTAFGSGDMPGKDSHLDIGGKGMRCYHPLAPKRYRELFESCPRRGLYDNVVYVRVVEHNYDDDRKPRLVIQYWFHYIYNDWLVNFHEGDWEMIELIWEVPDLSAAADQDPWVAAYSQHYSGEQQPWTGNDTRLQRIGTHPVVYVEHGSHASLFRRTGGQLLSGKKLIPRGAGLSGDIEYSLVPLIYEVPKEHNWISYSGHWGEEVELPSPANPDFDKYFSGPMGPAYQEQGDKWLRPAKWGLGLD